MAGRRLDHSDDLIPAARRQLTVHSPAVRFVAAPAAALPHTRLTLNGGMRMGKGKRHSVISDMNAMNFDDMSTMTDQEREKMQMSQTAPGKKSARPKKAM